jgi:DMSO/TMAO reductase YedYZ heme-binding membrane subunit
MAFLQVGVLLAALVHHVTAITLTVSRQGGNASSPLLYGMMFEVLLLLRSSVNASNQRKRTSTTLETGVFMARCS